MYVVYARIATIRSSFLTQSISFNNCCAKDLRLATCWIKHGEDETIPEEQPMVQDEDAEDNDMHIEEDNDTFVEQDNDMPGMMEDTQFDNNEDDICRLLHDGEVDFTDIRMFGKFQKMHEDRTTPLFSGCKEKHTKLHTMLTLL